MWLKTENFSNACGTVTLKSLLPQGAYAPHVHPRLQKRLARCTLDCGSKTSESPALRGFVAERCPIRGTSLYLAKIERPSPLEKPSCKVRLFAQNRSRKYCQKVTATTPSQTAFHRIFQPLAQTTHVRFHSRKRVHTRLSEKDRTQRLTRRNRGRFGWGWYHYPRTVPHVHKHPRAGYQNCILCRFGGLVGGAPKERREPRDSDALMRVAVPRRRGPAGLRCSFVHLPNQQNLLQSLLYYGIARYRNGTNFRTTPR